MTDIERVLKNLKTDHPGQAFTPQNAPVVEVSGLVKADEAKTLIRVTSTLTSSGWKVDFQEPSEGVTLLPKHIPMLLRTIRVKYNQYLVERRKVLLEKKVTNV